MADRRIGDFTGISDLVPDTKVSIKDVQYFLAGMKSGLFLDQSKIDFEISNITKKHPYQGPSFSEVLKLHELQKSGDTEVDVDGKVADAPDHLVTDPDDLDDYEFSISMIEEGNPTVHFSQKGSAVDTHDKKIVVTFPRAKVSNFFHEHDNSSNLVEKTVGYAKVYSLADNVDYSDYELILPPVFSNRDADSVPHDVVFGAESVAMNERYIAVSAYYSRPSIKDGDEEPTHSPPAAKVFLYEKQFPEEMTDEQDSGYKFISVFEDQSYAVEPVLEIHDDTLFVSDYIGNFVNVYSIPALKSIDNYSTPIPVSKITPTEEEIIPFGYPEHNSEWGRSLVTRDGKNLFIGAPNAICKYSLYAQTGRVDHWVYDPQENDEANEEGLLPIPWVWAQTIQPTEADLPWWTRWGHWEEAIAGAKLFVDEREAAPAADSVSADSVTDVGALCYSSGKYSSGDGANSLSRGFWLINVAEDGAWSAENFGAWWDGLGSTQQTNYNGADPGGRAGEWGVVFNEDLDSYFVPGGPGGPNPVPTPNVAYMYFTTMLRFGESLDMRGQRATIDYPERFSETETYLVVGCPRWLNDLDPDADLEELGGDRERARLGATFIFDVRYEEETLREAGGNSQLIKRMIPSTPDTQDQMVGSMEVGDFEGEFFGCEDVSLHLQALPAPATDAFINRGWPEFWAPSVYGYKLDTRSAPIHTSNMEASWPEDDMLHSAPNERGYFAPFSAQFPSVMVVDHNPAYNLDDDLTIEFWWRPQNTNFQDEGNTVLSSILSYQSYSTLDGLNDPAGYMLVQDPSTHTLKFRLNFDASPGSHTGEEEIAISTDEIDFNIWHHVAIVHGKHSANPEFESQNTNERYIELYVDGLREGKATFSAPKFDASVLPSDLKSALLSFGAIPTFTDTEVRFEDPADFEFTGVGQIHDLDDIRITHGVRYTEAFAKPESAFPVCYYPKGAGVSVAMDIDYDVYTLGNLLDGHIDKYNNERYTTDDDSVLESSDWEWTERVHLGKDEPVVGGAISIYDKDLVYGNLNDLRMYPHSPDIQISDGGNDNNLPTPTPSAIPESD